MRINLKIITKGNTMQVAGISNSATSAGMSILKSANEQPKLAGELISKTVEAMGQIQTPAQPVVAANTSTTGNIINITA